jgi:hypothetical protein
MYPIAGQRKNLETSASPRQTTQSTPLGVTNVAITGITLSTLGPRL